MPIQTKTLHIPTADGRADAFAAFPDTFPGAFPGGGRHQGC